MSLGRTPSFFLGRRLAASPYINRFLQPDTLIPDPANPQAFNRYSYVMNRPLNLSDPTGHICVGDFEGCMDDGGGTGDLIEDPDDDDSGLWVYSNGTINVPPIPSSGCSPIVVGGCASTVSNFEVPLPGFSSIFTPTYTYPSTSIASSPPSAYDSCQTLRCLPPNPSLTINLSLENIATGLEYGSTSADVYTFVHSSGQKSAPVWLGMFLSGTEQGLNDWSNDTLSPAQRNARIIVNILESNFTGSLAIKAGGGVMIGLGGPVNPGAVIGGAATLVETTLLVNNMFEKLNYDIIYPSIDKYIP